MWERKTASGRAEYLKTKYTFLGLKIDGITELEVQVDLTHGKSGKH